MPLALQALGRLTLKCGLTQSMLPSCPGALSLCARVTFMLSAFPP